MVVYISKVFIFNCICSTKNTNSEPIYRISKQKFVDSANTSYASHISITFCSGAGDAEGYANIFSYTISKKVERLAFSAQRGQFTSHHFAREYWTFQICFWYIFMITTRKSFCLSTRGIPPAPHIRPGPVQWEER